MGKCEEELLKKLCQLTVGLQITNRSLSGYPQATNIGNAPKNKREKLNLTVLYVHFGLVKTDRWQLATCWPSVGWLSAVCWLTVGQLLADWFFFRELLFKINKRCSNTNQRHLNCLDWPRNIFQVSCFVSQCFKFHCYHLIVRCFHGFYKLKQGNSSP